MNQFNDFLRRIFCKHNFVKVGFKQEIENNIRYALRNYNCTKCGKSIWVDGRYDKYEKENY